LLKGNIVWGGDTLSTLSTPQIAKQEVEAMNKTISNQSIKEAENLAKPQATPKPKLAQQPQPPKQEPQKATNEAQQFGKTEQLQTKEQELVELAKTLGVYNENY
ncbi:hypothetical protein, partial [Campylobacter porcelli]|nr:hypothetical protein [Campylobacter sp. CX2-4855-23]